MRTKTFSSLTMLAAGLFAFTATALHAQVGINNTAANPDASAILDLNTGNAGVNKGFLPPQVALTNVATAAPVTTPATGLIVYSTAAPTGGDGTGYYYWNGTGWVGLAGGSAGAIGGSGVDNYVARWTPNGTTLGTGLIQDNGTGVGVNSAPVAGNLVYASGTTGIAVNGTSDTGVAGYSATNMGVVAYSLLNDGVWANADYGGVYGNGYNGYGVWGQDGMGDEAILAWDYYGTYGYGLYSTGVNYGVYTTASAAAGVGVYASGDTAINAYGSWNGIDAYSANNDGISSKGLWGGVYASGDNYGLFGYGSNYGGIFEDPNGDEAVLAYNSSELGIYSYGLSSGGYFVDGNYDVATSGGDYAYIAYGPSAAGAYFEDDAGDYVYDAYAGYSNFGSGPKNTIVKDQSGQYRAMSCPEAPEVLFQDYGTSQLVNGKVHIELDKTFAYTVCINEKHPLRVMVTLNDADCNGVAVINRSATGFDVVELAHGTSNASFTYEVVANRANTKTHKGVARNYADIRYNDAPGPLARPKQASSLTQTPNNPNRSEGKHFSMTAKPKPSPTATQGKN